MFEWPRGGFKTQIAVVSLLEACGIGRPSKTLGVVVNKSMPSWDKQAALYELAPLVRSQPLVHGDGAIADDGTRVLQEKSCSSAYAMVLMCRWSWCTPQGGGFKTPSDRGAALDLLVRLSSMLYKGGGFCIPLCTSGDIRKHESGIILGGDVVSLLVCNDGKVDGSNLLDMGVSPSHLWRSWAKEWQATFRGEHPEFLEFLQWAVVVAFKRTGRRLFSMQVVWGLGQQLDRCILKLSEGVRPLGNSHFVDETSVELTNTMKVALYHQAVCEHATVNAQLCVSGCIHIYIYIYVFVYICRLPN
jgi:hypothetical protein